MIETNNYEIMLVGALLADPILVTAIPMDAGRFKDARMAAVYEVLWGLREGEIIPATVCEELERRGWKDEDATKLVSILTGLYPEAPELDAVEFYASKVTEDAGKRFLSSRLEVVVSALRQPRTELSGVVGELVSLVTAAQSGCMDARVPTADAIASRILESYSGPARMAFGSGFHHIDRALAAGGIKPGHLWVINAAYKSYKTRTALHIADKLLSSGKSVAYYGLESTQIAFSTALMSVHFGLPESLFERYYSAGEDERDGMAGLRALRLALEWYADLGSRFRVYDRKDGVGDWRRFRPIVSADMMRYGADLMIVDHVQQWSHEREMLEEISNMLIDVTLESEVAMIALSQVSNETMRTGSPGQMLATKGTGAFGAAVDAGLEVYKDPDKSDFIANRRVHEALEMAGMSRYLNAESLVSEIAMHLKVVRKGATPKFYVLFDPYSGKVLAEYDRPYALGD